MYTAVTPSDFIPWSKGPPSKQRLYRFIVHRAELSNSQIISIKPFSRQNRCVVGQHYCKISTILIGEDTRHFRLHETSPQISENYGWDTRSTLFTDSSCWDSSTTLRWLEIILLTHNYIIIQGIILYKYFFILWCAVFCTYFEYFVKSK